MRRKFKHKVTDWKAIESGFADQHYKIYNAIDDYEGHLSFGMVENSNDWQEITEPELVEGRWYINNSGDVFRIKEFCGDVKVDNFVWSDGVIYYDGEFVPPEGIKREATPEEIHKALEAIRLHKELVEGTQVVDVLNAGKYKIGNKDSFYVKEQDCLYKRSFNGKINIPLYWEGQWAEKVEEPILVTEDGYKVYEYETRIYGVIFPYNVACPIKPSDYYGYGKAFYKKENAEAHIDYYKPKYSDRDLEAIKRHIIEDKKINVYVFNGSLEYVQGVTDAYNKAERLINELKASKND